MSNRPFLVSCLINICFLTLFLVLGVVRYGALDDYFMASVLTGAYGGEFDPHLYFVNGVIAYALWPLFWLFPKVGWFYIFEMASIFCAFVVFSFLIIHKMGFRQGLLLALLINTLSLEYYGLVSFTQCASLLSAAGFLLLFVGCRERQLWLLLGAVFVIIGALLRWQAFLLGIPYAFLLFFLLGKWSAKELIKMLVAALLCSIAIFGARTFDKSLYSDGEYRYYAQIQPRRSFFGDGAHFDKEAVYDELEERSMEGSDFSLLAEWNFYDTKVFSSDSLDRIIRIVNRNVYLPEYKKIPFAVWISVSNAFTKPAAWCWCILCVVLIGGSGRGWLYPWLSLWVIGASYVYLLLLNRLVYHVEMGIWAYAFACSIPFLKSPQTKSFLSVISNKKLKLAIVMTTLVVFSMVSLYSQPLPASTDGIIKIPTMSKDWHEFLDFAKSHPEHAYLLSFERYKELGTFKDPSYRAVEPSSWQNIFTVGYWNIYLPGMIREFQKRGVENPLRDIVKPNVFFLGNGGTPDYRNYYKVHYQKNVEVDTVYTFGDLLLLKYRILEE